MTQSLKPTVLPPPFPDHTQLPESDGTFVKNFQEHPQSWILTDSIGQLSIEQVAEALGLPVREISFVG
jgi:hypothetical protein